MKPTALSSAAVRRLSCAAALAVAGAVIGCDEPADSAALRDLGAAVDAGGGSQQYADGLRDLQGRQGLSEATQALISRAAGDVQRLYAYDTLAGLPSSDEREGQPGLLARQLEAIRLTEQMNAAARDLAAIAVTRREVAAAAQGVTGGVEAMLAKATAIRDEPQWTPAVGEPDTNGPYAGIDGEVSDLDRATFQRYTEARQIIADLQLPGLAGVQAELEQLQARIGEAEASLQGLRDQRAQLQTRAGARERDAVAARGDEAVAAAREVADLNIEAGNLQQQIAVAEQGLGELQRDLALLQSRQAALTSAAEAMQTQATAARDSLGAATGLQTVDRQLADQAAAIVGGRGEDEPGLSAMAEQLAEVRQAGDDLRAEAIDALTAAEEAFGNAMTSAQSAIGARRSSAQPGGELEAEALSAVGQSATLALAQTRRQIGDLKLGRAAVEMGLVRLGANLRRAGEAVDVSAVEAVTDGAADELANALSEAASLFEEAGDAAEQVTGSSPEVQRAALGQRALALSGLAAAARLAEAAQALDAQVSLTGLPSVSEVEQRVAELATAAQQAGVTLPPVNGIDLAAAAQAAPAEGTPAEGAGGDGFGQPAEPGAETPAEGVEEAAEEMVDDAESQGLGE